MVSERRCAALDNRRFSVCRLTSRCSNRLPLPPQPYVEDELGSGTVELLRRLKETIDPQNIMVRLLYPFLLLLEPDPRLMTCMLGSLLQNPGKLIPERKA